jgi:hypothetical protein
MQLKAFTLDLQCHEILLSMALTILIVSDFLGFYSRGSFRIFKLKLALTQEKVQSIYFCISKIFLKSNLYPFKKIS